MQVNYPHGHWTLDTRGDIADIVLIANIADAVDK